jgi:23S rRNA (cytidine2498-2'-O)-methyltransferase
VSGRHGDVISRAYWKVVEALAWSELPVYAGDRCVEIGSAPGGSSQALLDAGLSVVGIDPADMDEGLLRHPRFQHIRARAADLKRREFRGIRWLVADSNVAPRHTLDTVEAIVTHREVRIRGMLLTLKLLNWRFAEEIPAYLERIRSWGYRHVRARQLAFNRREVCVAALVDRSQRRPRVVKGRPTKRRPAGSSGVAPLKIPLPGTLAGRSAGE